MKVTELKTPIKEARPRPKRSEDGGRNIKARNKNLQTSSFANQDLDVADQQTSQLVGEIRAMKIALVEYQLKESKWREEDRQWLQQKEAELMKKLQEFEEITKRVLRFVRLSDGNSKPSVKTNDSSENVAAEASRLSVASRIDGQGECLSRSASEIRLTDSEIYQELKEADERACKTAGEIRSIKSAITEYHAQRENCTWMKEDTEWLEEKQAELMQKLAEFEEVTKSFLRYIGLADVSSTQFPLQEETCSDAAALSNSTEDNEDDEGNCTANSDNLSTRSSEIEIHERIKMADEKACRTADEIREIKTEIANYHKQKETSEPMEEDAKWLERKKSELINKLEEFEEITRKVNHLVGLTEVSTTKSLPVLPRLTQEESYGGSWVKFMMEQFFFGLNLVYYP